MEGEPSTANANANTAAGGLVSERQVRCALDVAAAAWLVEAKDLEGARRVLEAVLATLPHDVRARTMLAQVLFRMRDFVAASELYERLLSEFRGDVALTFNLALSHLKSGRPDLAAAGLRRVLEARPDHTRARVWLRVADAAIPAAQPPAVPPQRVSVRPSRLEDLPRVALPPGAAVAQDATGVVSVRVENGTRWLARPNALHGYEGDVTVEAQATNGGRVVAIAGSGTAFLRGRGALVVIDLHDEEICVRASALIAYASSLTSESADPDVVGDFDEDIVRVSGAGAIVLEVRAELVALPVGLTHATTVRWDSVIGWTGHVVGAPSDSAGADGRPLARFAGNGSLLLAMHDDAAAVPAIQSPEWYGRYQVLRRLEGTPSEEVLLARSHGPGGSQRKVVLRRHLSRCEADSPFLQLLARETDAYAVLTHPGIVRLYDFLLLDGHPVLVLEYVSGLSLAAVDTALTENQRSIGRDVALYVAHAVFTALAAAHGAHEPDTGEPSPVIHRDVRAGNVLVGWSGDVKLGSFATAKAGAPSGESGDVRAAARLLVEMLAGGRAVDPPIPELAPDQAGVSGASSPPEDPAANKLEAIKPPLAPRLRDALHRALANAVANPSRARSISAAEIAHEIEKSVDLPGARVSCEEELRWLRETVFGNVALSSAPPPVTAADDEAFYQSLDFPKPSPVPSIPPDAEEQSDEDLLRLSEKMRAHKTLSVFSVEEEGASESGVLWGPNSIALSPSVGAPNVGSPDASAPAAGPFWDPNAAALDVADGGHGASGARTARTEPPALRFPMTRPSLTPSAFDASDSAPPVQPPSFGPGASAASRGAKGKRYVATAVGVCTVAIVTGVATVDFASWSGAGHSAATSTPPMTESREGTEPIQGARQGSAIQASPAAALPVVETQVITRPAPPASDPPPAPSASDLPSIPLADYEGVLRVPARAAQHRIFVDGHVIGEGAGDFPVRCGTRSVRVGSKGEEQSIEVPCGRVVAIE